MSIVLNIVLFLALVIVSIFFHQYIRKTSAMTKKMENQIKSLSIYLKCEDQIQNQPDPQLRLVIELIDPISIAKKQSNIAKIVSGIAPNIIISEVYREAKKRAMLDVKRHNVEANINIMSI